MSQVRKVFTRLDLDISAVRSVAAVRASTRHVSFPTETQATISTIAGFAKQLNLINKHRRNSLRGLVTSPQDTEATLQNVGSTLSHSGVAKGTFGLIYQVVTRVV